MKILLYSINFAPELTGIGKYTGEMAAWLAARGHQVRVVTAPPYYPGWAVAEGHSGAAWRREQWQGVEVWRCPLWVPARPGGAKRLLHLASFALSSLPVMLRQVLWQPDAVWVVEPPLFCAPTAWGVARLSGARVWLHIQDYEVDAAFELGLLKGQWLKRTVLAAEQWLMRRVDLVSTISQRMLERAQSKGVDARRLVAFPNWVDVAAFASANVQAYRAELGIAPGAVVALYSGNMGRKQGLELLAQVARLCADLRQGSDPLWFVFCGNGVGRTDLVAQCKDVPHVRFLDLQPAERLADLLALADIHLLPQRADAADLVMPSKLTGMLASARPVVATAFAGTELANVVHGCGLVVPPEDPRAMADAVLALAADAPWRVRLGLAGRAHAVQQMDRETVLRRFESALMDDGKQVIRQGRVKPGLAWGLLVFMILALLVGTLMPGALRNTIESRLNAPPFFSSASHFALFLGIGLIARLKPLAFGVARVVLAVLALGLLSEALQFFAVDRHPRLIDVLIDLAGAMAGIGLAAKIPPRSGRR